MKRCAHFHHTAAERFTLLCVLTSSKPHIYVFLLLFLGFFVCVCVCVCARARMIVKVCFDYILFFAL